MVNETPEPVEGEVEEVEGVKVEEVAEEAIMSINDGRDRFTGIVNSDRAGGIATVTSRRFAALEGF